MRRLEDANGKSVQEQQHCPVMLRDFLEAVQPVAGERWIDGTFGRGGHTGALLERGVSVLAMDRDEAAEVCAQEVRLKWPGQFNFVRDNFRNMKKCAENLGWTKVQGILLDLGVSSPQLDTAARGFSFRQDGPLDMRMDARLPLTAADLVNTLDEEALHRLFREEGDETESRRLARAIVNARVRQPIQTTVELAELIRRTIPWRQAKGAHPATKVFQALRIAVNDEMASIEEALPDAASLLRPRGAFAVISFHSGEDRRVKRFFRRFGDARVEDPLARCHVDNPERIFERVERYLPSDEEAHSNPRSRSARLRIAWRASV